MIYLSVLRKKTLMEAYIGTFWDKMTYMTWVLLY